MNEKHQCSFCGTDLHRKTYLCTGGKLYCNESCRDFAEAIGSLERKESPTAQVIAQMELRLDWGAV